MPTGLGLPSSSSRADVGPAGGSRGRERGFGHLWKTADGGVTWTDVSGNLPDVPLNDVLVLGAKRVEPISAS